MQGHSFREDGFPKRRDNLFKTITPDLLSRIGGGWWPIRTLPQWCYFRVGGHQGANAKIKADVVGCWGICAENPSMLNAELFLYRFSVG